MIRQEIDIKPYGWHVIIYYAVDCYYVEDIMQELSAICVDDDFEKEARRCMEEGLLDTGFTYSNLEKRETILVINRTSSAKEFDNSLNHERQHLLMHIAQECGINVFSEELSYLAGDVSMMMHPVTKNLVSSCGCHSKAVKRLIRQTKEYLV